MLSHCSAGWKCIGRNLPFRPAGGGGAQAHRRLPGIAASCWSATDAQEKEGDNEGARGEIMSGAFDMFSFRKWWDTQVEIFCRQKETQD